MGLNPEMRGVADRTRTPEESAREVQEVFTELRFQGFHSCWSLLGPTTLGTLLLLQNQGFVHEGEETAVFQAYCPVY